MLKISRLADYAIVLTGCLAQVGDSQRSAAALAAESGLPEPTASKILKLLSRGNVVSSARGVAGGYRLTRSISEISVADIIRAVDGPIMVTACAEGPGHDCQLGERCAMQGRWDRVNKALKDALESISMVEMTGGPIVAIDDARVATA